MIENLIEQLAKGLDGEVKEVGILPDGSGFACVSYPLPKDHWLIRDPDGDNVPPMPFRMGTSHPDRKRYAEALREAGKYALRASTMNGKDMDFDPDAVLQNLIVGMLGYWSEDGFSTDSFANPPVEIKSND